MRRSLFRLRRIPLLVLGLALAAPAAAGAQTLADYDYDQLTFRGVGLGGGYLWSERIENTELYSLRFDLGYLGPGVRVVPTIEYWQSALEAAQVDTLAARLGIPADQLGSIEWRDVSLSVDGHFVWRTPFDVFTFVGVGLGLHALNGQGAAVDGTFVEDLLDDITAGVNGIIGFEFEPVERFRVFAEGRYTAMNSLQYASARGGVQVMFSTGPAEVGAVAPPPDPGPVHGARMVRFSGLVAPGLIALEPGAVADGSGTQEGGGTP